MRKDIPIIYKGNDFAFKLTITKSNNEPEDFSESKVSLIMISTSGKKIAKEITLGSTIVTWNGTEKSYTNIVNAKFTGDELQDKQVYSAMLVWSKNALDLNGEPSKNWARVVHKEVFYITDDESEQTKDSAGNIIAGVNYEDVGIALGYDGKSAYQYAKEGGYTGTEEEFSLILSSISAAGYEIIKNKTSDYAEASLNKSISEEKYFSAKGAYDLIKSLTTDRMYDIDIESNDFEPAKSEALLVVKKDNFEKGINNDLTFSQYVNACNNVAGDTALTSESLVYVVKELSATANKYPLMLDMDNQARLKDILKKSFVISYNSEQDANSFYTIGLTKATEETIPATPKSTISLNDSAPSIS